MKRVSGTAVVLVAALLAGVAPSAALARASFEILPFSTRSAGNDRLFSLDLSADGRTVVGLIRTDMTRRLSQTAAARWDLGRGTTRLSAQEDANDDLPFGVSADGSTVVGRFQDPTTGIRQGTLVRQGEPPRAVLSELSQLTDVSADGGVAIGGRAWRNLRPGGGGFIWDATNGARDMAALTGITDDISAHEISDDGTIVVGTVFPESDIFPVERGYSWSEATGYVPLATQFEGQSSRALGISGDGSTIVGFVRGGGPFLSAARWTEGGVITLSEGRTEVGTGPFSFLADVDPLTAESVSLDGSVIVGQANIPGTDDDAYIHFADRDETRRLSDLLIELGVVGLENWDLNIAVSLSADGRVVTGWATRRSSIVPLPPELQQLGSSYFAFRAVIPEPSTALMLGLGLAALGTRRR